MKGRKDIKSEDGKPFSSENQPSPEAKKAGKRKVKALKELAPLLLTGEGSEKIIEVARNAGINLDYEYLTVEIAMTLKQIDKSLKDGDTRAYNAAMDRLRGKPKQDIDVMSGGEKINSLDFNRLADQTIFIDSSNKSLHEGRLFTKDGKVIDYKAI